MELAHLITGQIILISTFLSVAYLSENIKVTNILNSVRNLKYIRIADEKGVILFLIVLAICTVFLQDFLSSQASVSKAKRICLNIKRSKKLLIQHINILFINFICAYIFKSINQQVYNLSGLAVVFMMLNVLFKALNLKMIATWGYFGFFMCNIFITAYTFVARFENFAKILFTIIKNKTF